MVATTVYTKRKLKFPAKDTPMPHITLSIKELTVNSISFYILALATQGSFTQFESVHGKFGSDFRNHLVCDVSLFGARAKERPQSQEAPIQAWKRRKPQTGRSQEIVSTANTTANTMANATAYRSI